VLEVKGVTWWGACKGPPSLQPNLLGAGRCIFGWRGKDDDWGEAERRVSKD